MFRWIELNGLMGIKKQDMPYASASAASALFLYAMDLRIRFDWMALWLLRPKIIGERSENPLDDMICNDEFKPNRGLIKITDRVVSNSLLNLQLRSLNKRLNRRWAVMPVFK